MNTPTTLAAFGVGLVVVFGAAAGVGSAVGPVAAAPAPAHGAEETAHGEAQGAGAGHTEAALPPGGLAVAQDGYALRLEPARFAAGRPGVLAFTVLGPDGAPLTDYVRRHEKDLHLVVVRR